MSEVVAEGRARQTVATDDHTRAGGGVDQDVTDAFDPFDVRPSTRGQQR